MSHSIKVGGSDNKRHFRVVELSGKKVSFGEGKSTEKGSTRGSKNKVYGPYEGYFHKYNAEELKKAKTSKGKQGFTMKPVVHLV